MTNGVAKIVAIIAVSIQNIGSCAETTSSSGLRFNTAIRTSKKIKMRCMAFAAKFLLRKDEAVFGIGSNTYDDEESGGPSFGDRRSTRTRISKPALPRPSAVARVLSPKAAYSVSGEKNSATNTNRSRRFNEPSPRTHRRCQQHLKPQTGRRLLPRAP